MLCNLKPPALADEEKSGGSKNVFFGMKLEIL